ncbi:uncharacterized protein BDW70DRAFT_74903 [Aspergillus foveolatus]|uniref:uncharacterized protein n=1 Tax=Aspergillus foveolatus TaxID=210207 RepID=UPI003CCC997A
MGLLSIVTVPFSVFLVYPVYYVAFSAYFLLSLLASPFIYLGFAILWLVLFPIKILISLKALLIYLGVASLAGAGVALALYFITTLAIDSLLNLFSNLSTPVRLRPKLEGRAIERAKYTLPEDSSDSGTSNDLWTSSSWGLGSGHPKKRGLVSETILEEESQDSEL